MPNTPENIPVLRAALTGLLVELATIADGLKWTGESLAAARHKLGELQGELSRLLKAKEGGQS